MLRRSIASIAMFTLLPMAVVFGQSSTAPSWRFRFPDSAMATGGVTESSEDPTRVASRQDPAGFSTPAQIEIPSLSDSQIVIPSIKTQPPTSQTGSKADSTNDASSGDQREARDDAASSTAGRDPASGNPEARVAAANIADPYAVAPTTFMNPVSSFGSWFPLRRTNRFMVQAEYLYWSAEGMRTPPLVTSSPTGTARADAAYLGGPATTILYGGDRINDGWEHGYRVAAGYAFDPNLRWKLEGEYLRILDREETFSAASDDPVAPTNIIGRPFFDLINGQETAQLISFDDVISGRIDIASTSKLSSLGAYVRGSTCPTPGPCDVIAINSPLSMQRGRFDVLLGYRYANLQDSISFAEDLRSLDVANPGSFQIRERFATENMFHGIELGMAYVSSWRRFSTELVAKVAAGNNHQTVAISGFSDIVEAGFLERFPGGLYAQRSNIGVYERNELAVLPQLTFNLGTQLTSFLTVRVGYSLFYFSNVVRAGDHIDTDLNPNLFPPEQLPLVTSVLRPDFEFNETDYWAHGANFGADFRF
ncbi:MAG: BBP7 family outer membrane beta-barrel protein [Pirellulaceae bacterium]